MNRGCQTSSSALALRATVRRHVRLATAEPAIVARAAWLAAPRTQPRVVARAAWLAPRVAGRRHGRPMVKDAAVAGGASAARMAEGRTAAGASRTAGLANVVL
jgi:hypothetical protein